MKVSVFCSHLVKICMSFQDIEIQWGGDLWEIIVMKFESQRGLEAHVFCYYEAPSNDKQLEIRSRLPIRGNLYCNANSCAWMTMIAYFWGFKEALHWRKFLDDEALFCNNFYSFDVTFYLVNLRGGGALFPIDYKWGKAWPPSEIDQIKSYP